MELLITRILGDEIGWSGVRERKTGEGRLSLRLRKCQVKGGGRRLLGTRMETRGKQSKWRRGGLIRLPFFNMKAGASSDEGRVRRPYSPWAGTAEEKACQRRGKRCQPCSPGGGATRRTPGRGGGRVETSSLVLLRSSGGRSKQFEKGGRG